MMTENKKFAITSGYEDIILLMTVNDNKSYTTCEVIELLDYRKLLKENKKMTLTHYLKKDLQTMEFRHTYKGDPHCSLENFLDLRVKMNTRVGLGYWIKKGVKRM